MLRDTEATLARTGWAHLEVQRYHVPTLFLINTQIAGTALRTNPGSADDWVEPCRARCVAPTMAIGSAVADRNGGSPERRFAFALRWRYVTDKYASDRGQGEFFLRP